MGGMVRGESEMSLFYCTYSPSRTLLPLPEGRAKTISRESRKRRAPPAILNAEKPITQCIQKLLAHEREDKYYRRSESRSSYCCLAPVRIAPAPGQAHEDRCHPQGIEDHQQSDEGDEDELCQASDY